MDAGTAVAAMQQADVTCTVLPDTTHVLRVRDPDGSNVLHLCAKAKMTDVAGKVATGE